MSYPIYDFLEILWLRIHKSLSKQDHLFTRCLWCLKSKHHYIQNRDMNQLNSQSGIILFKDSYESIG